MAKLTRVVITLIALGSFAGRAEAQALYYRTIPIGERAIGLGGAYTGIADDPSASYYNPAGLMNGGRFQLLGSLSSIVFTRQTIEDAFDSPDIERTFTSKHTTTLPHFVGTVVKFGKQKFGDHQFAVAYSSFEAARERLSASFSEVQPTSSADLLINDNYRMRWWGVSIATRVRRDVSIGLSAFLSNQSYGYNEDVGLASGGTLEDTGVRVNGDFATTSTRIGVGSWGFVFRLGALYRINPKWQIGFMFQPPGAPIKKDASVFRRFTAEIGDESRYFLFDEGDFKSRFPIPFEFRIGTAFKANTLTTISWDVSINGRVRDGKLIERPPELEGVGGVLGIYFPNTNRRRWTPNLAIGAEHMFGKAVVAGGLFTNISAAPNVPETSTEYKPDQISTYGASIAVGVDTKGYRLTVGATGYFGRGDALAFTVDREAQVSSYRRTKSNVTGLVLYVAGAVSVASKGAKDVQEKYKERKVRKHEENGDAEWDEEGEEGMNPEEGPEDDTGADGDPDVSAEPDADADVEPDADASAEADADVER